MNTGVTVKIGGEAGQGLQTVGILLAEACQKTGLYLMAINDFESRIRGGHNFFQIIIRDQQVRAPRTQVNLLVGLDDKTVELHREEVVEDGLIIVDADHTDDQQGTFRIPLGDLAEKAGGAITRNTVAAGACLGLLGIPEEVFHTVIDNHFKEHKEEILKKNHKAATLGYEAVASVDFPYAFKTESRSGRGMLLSGDQAIGLGALAADCRLAAFYPMSPSTAINIYLASLSGEYPVVVEQAEDEIAAINMAIGGSFAGARSMVATSGGGFCLMTEALGLAAITETPIVVFNCQRPGPATGLPTRTAQSDLHFVIRAAQDEFPRFVFAPGSPEEMFATTIRAFTMAEKYQVPAIVLLDQYLIDSLFIVEGAIDVPDKTERFVETSDDPDYKRFALTSSGISPRVLPCAGKARVVVTGNEHDEDGHMTEASETRNSMVNKRNKKIPAMLTDINPPYVAHGDADLLLVGWGSTRGVLQEVVEILRADDVEVGHLHFSDLWPFPAEKAESALKQATRWITVENNSSGQLAQLIRQETGLKAHDSVLKYDGRPFCVDELYVEIKDRVG